jgi:hypothetical protein
VAGNGNWSEQCGLILARRGKYGGSGLPHPQFDVDRFGNCILDIFSV